MERMSLVIEKKSEMPKSGEENARSGYLELLETRERPIKKPEF